MPIVDLFYGITTHNQEPGKCGWLAKKSFLKIYEAGGEGEIAWSGLED